MTAIYPSSPASNGAFHNDFSRASPHGLSTNTSPGRSDDDLMLSADSVLSEGVVIGLSPHSFVNISFDDVIDYPHDSPALGFDMDWVMPSPSGRSQTNPPHSSSASEIGEQSYAHLGISAPQSSNVFRAPSIGSTLSSASNRGLRPSPQSVSPVPHLNNPSIQPTIESMQALSHGHQQNDLMTSSIWPMQTPMRHMSDAPQTMPGGYAYRPVLRSSVPVTLSQPYTTNFTTTSYTVEAPWPADPAERAAHYFGPESSSMAFDMPEVASQMDAWNFTLPLSPDNISPNTVQPNREHWPINLTMAYQPTTAALAQPAVSHPTMDQFHHVPSHFGPASMSQSPLSQSPHLQPPGPGKSRSGSSGASKPVPLRRVTRTSPSFVHEPYPKPHAEGSKKRQGGRNSSGFDDDKKMRIKGTRELGACWTCALQRDECVPDESGMNCKRCERRFSRPGSDSALTCCRTKLPDLKEYFIPEILTGLYARPAVKQFAAAHIHHWHKRPIQVPCRLVWGFEPLYIEMYEFTPRTDVITQAIISKDDWVHERTDTTCILSPPLALEILDNASYQDFGEEVDSIAWKWLRHFVPRFYSSREDDFCRRQLRLLSEFALPLPESSVEHKFMRVIFKLLVVTYLLSHAITIAPKQQEMTLQQMDSYQPDHYEKNALPKLANRQLKHAFSNMRDRLMDRVLKSLSQFLKSSKKHDRWTAAFCAILGLGIAMECAQQMIHVHFDTEVLENNLGVDDAARSAQKAVEQIDDRFDFVTKLFRHKYHVKFNPFREDKVYQAELGDSAWVFVEQTKALVKEKRDFLTSRRLVPNGADNSIKYTARLQARFLLGFWS